MVCSMRDTLNWSMCCRVKLQARVMAQNGIAYLVLPLKLSPHAAELDVHAARGVYVIHYVNVDVIQHHHVPFSTRRLVHDVAKNGASLSRGDLDVGPAAQEVLISRRLVVLCMTLPELKLRQSSRALIGLHAQSCFAKVLLLQRTVLWQLAACAAKCHVRVSKVCSSGVSWLHPTNLATDSTGDGILSACGPSNHSQGAWTPALLGCLEAQPHCCIMCCSGLS